MFNVNIWDPSAAAKSVRIYLEARECIECSWNSETKRYDANPYIAEWHNGREDGYVIGLYRSDMRKSLCIAFFEHRNSDNICVLVFEAQTILNPPTLHDIPEGVYKDKWDVTESFNYNQSCECADYIYQRLEDFWGGKV